MTSRSIPQIGSKGQRIAVLENLQQNAPQSEQLAIDAWAELGTRGDVDRIVSVLQRAGYVAEFFEGNLSLLETLPKFEPDLCFNMCEGHFGESRECHVPALLEMLRLPYTGSSILTLALTSNKELTNRLLSLYGLPTPPNQLFETPDDAIDSKLKFPLFVKPVGEGSSKGVALESIVRDEKQLRERVNWVISTYKQPALVEHFIRGREMTIGVLGNRSQGIEQDSNITILPPFEILFGESRDGVYTYEIKSSIPDGWVAGSNYLCPAPVDSQLEQELNRLAKAAFLHIGCRDYARIDFRLDAEDRHKPYILEVNALPGIFCDWSDMSFAATAACMSYDELILSIVKHATIRHEL